MPDPTLDTFDLDALLRTPLQLSIVHRDGTEEAVPTTSVALSLTSGANLNLTTIPSTGEVVFTTDPSGITENPYYCAKYTALATGLTGTVSGVDADDILPAWEFSQAALWIGSMSGAVAEPLTGDLALVTDSCGAIGLFPALPTNTWPDDDEAGLAIFDVCGPGIDDLTILRLSAYYEQLAAYANWLLLLLLEPDPTLLEGQCPWESETFMPAVPTGLIPQTAALVDFVTWIQHQRSVSFRMGGSGNAFTFAVRYVNPQTAAAVGEAPDGITITINVAFYQKTAELFALWDGVTATSMRVYDIERTTGDLHALVSDVAQAGTGAVTITLTTDGTTLAAGETLYADCVLILDGLPTVTDLLDGYRAVATMTINPTHMLVSGDSFVTRTVSAGFLPEVVWSDSASASAPA